LDATGNAKPIAFPIKRIVFATDFLESSRLALDYAVGFAYHYGATLIMVHAMDLSQAAREAEMVSEQPSVSRKLAADRLEALAAGVRRIGIPVELDLREGEPCKVVLESAARNKTDLLVLGTHGVHRGLDHLLIGSNTEKILLSAHCPTLTVGRYVMGGVDLDIKFKEIFYVSDFTPEAAAAAPYALALAQEFNAPVEICQMIPQIAEDDPALRRELAEKYCEAIKLVVPGKEREWCTPAFQLERSLAAEQVLERANADPAALIVLGVRTESHLGRHLHTSFAYELHNR
jgi:nucleotide-binding universal stress UspA family protein